MTDGSGPHCWSIASGWTYNTVQITMDYESTIERRGVRVNKSISLREEHDLEMDDV